MSTLSSTSITDMTLLRIHVGEQQKYDHQPLYELIVMKAHDAQLSGATVLRGMMGFGHLGHVHSAKILRLSEDLPMIIEVIDTEERLMAFLASMGEILGSSLITLEKVHVIQYGKRDDGALD